VLQVKSGEGLIPFLSDPILRFKQLHDGFTAIPEHPVSMVLAEIERTTQPDDPILVVTTRGTQFHYFSKRPMSGLLNVYFIGVLDGKQWRMRNLEHVKRNPPKLIITERPLQDLSEDSDFRVSQPELYEYLTRNYTKVVYARNGWLLLGGSGIEGQSLNNLINDNK